MNKKPKNATHILRTGRHSVDRIPTDTGIRGAVVLSASQVSGGGARTQNPPLTTSEIRRPPSPQPCGPFCSCFLKILLLQPLGTIFSFTDRIYLQFTLFYFILHSSQSPGFWILVDDLQVPKLETLLPSVSWAPKGGMIVEARMLAKLPTDIFWGPFKHCFLPVAITISTKVWMLILITSAVRSSQWVDGVTLSKISYNQVFKEHDEKLLLSGML